MKRLKYMFLVGLLLSNLTLWGQFNPTNPPEPSKPLNVHLVTEPIGAGELNRSADFTAVEGEEIFLSADSNIGYHFEGWEKDGEVLSTYQRFHFVMGNSDVTLKAKFVFSPNNPPDPVIRYQLFLESNPVGTGDFNYNSGTLLEEGERVGLNAHGRSGYQFVHWYKTTDSGEEEILSTRSSYYYTMGDRKTTLKAKFVYNPSNPEEPNQPSEKYYYLQGYSYSTQQGSTVHFPIYLVNSGTVSGISFDMELEKGIAVDEKGIILSNRCQGHTLQVTVGEASNRVHFDIAGEQNIQGTGGVLLTIPLVVPSSLAPGSYPVRFPNGTVTLPNGTEKQLSTYDSYLYVTRAPRKMGAEDYAALCDMYGTMNGSAWDMPWNIKSDIIDDSNWQGVTFTGIHIESIGLSGRNVKGSIPVSVLALPTLRQLDLSHNLLDWDVQDLADAITRHSIVPELTQITLNNNRLKGDVSVFVGAFPALNGLDVSNNCFSKLSSPLPDGIQSLNLSYQELPVDTQIVRLAVKQTLEFPSILMYRHAEKAYGAIRSLSIYSVDLNSTDASLAYASGFYKMSWNEWKAPSGSGFLLRTTDGDAYGSTIPWQIIFDKGDANADAAIDVLDVQETLNYMIRQRGYPFVYAAADTYGDANITVQDIVMIINMILDRPVSEIKPENTLRSRAIPPVQLCVEDGKLVIYSDTEIAAADIVLQNCNQAQLRMLLNVNQFQSVMKNIPGGVRLVFFSSMGETLPAGRTVVAEVSSQEASVEFADLADTQAQRISSIIIPTGLHSVTIDAISVYTSEDKAFAVLPDGIGSLVVNMAKVDGSLVATQTLESPIGTVQLVSGLCPGIYLLQLRIEVAGELMYKNVKIVISK